MDIKKNKPIIIGAIPNSNEFQKLIYKIKKDRG